MINGPEIVSIGKAYTFTYDRKNSELITWQVKGAEIDFSEAKNSVKIIPNDYWIMICVQDNNKTHCIAPSIELN